MLKLKEIILFYKILAVPVEDSSQSIYLVRLGVAAAGFYCELLNEILQLVDVLVEYLNVIAQFKLEVQILVLFPLQNLQAGQ